MTDQPHLEVDPTTGPAPGAPARNGTALFRELGPGLDVGTEVAWLDSAGVIVATNAAWDAFCLANDGDPALCGAGVSYLQVCDAVDDPVARNIGSAIRAAIGGDLPGVTRMRVPCDAPGLARWMDVFVSTWFDERHAGIGATVTICRAQTVESGLAPATIGGTTSTVAGVGDVRVRRAAVDRLVADLTVRVLADGATDDLLQQIVDRTASGFEADGVALIGTDPHEGTFRHLAVSGPAAGQVLSGPGRLDRAVLRDLIEQADTAEPFRARTGSRVVAVFPGPNPPPGLLVALREPHRARFVAADADLLDEMARQLAVVLELGEARARLLELSVVEDRERITADLLDRVIGELFATGLTLQAIAAGGDRPDLVARIAGTIDTLDRVISRIRTTVFGLRPR